MRKSSEVGLSSYTPIYKEDLSAYRALFLLILASRTVAQNAGFINIVNVRKTENFLIMFLIKFAGMPCRTKFMEKPHAIRHSQVAYSVIFVSIKRMQSDTNERKSQYLVGG